MKTRIITAALLALALAFVLLSARSARAETPSDWLRSHPAAPSINEVMPNPQDGDFEWVELHCATYHTLYLPLVLRNSGVSASLGLPVFSSTGSARLPGLVDISGWQITDEDGNDYTIPDALPAVPPDSYILIYFDGQGATEDDYDFSDGVAVLHTPAGVINVFEDEADQVGLYSSNSHGPDTIRDFVAWGEATGEDAASAVAAELWRESWWVNLHIGSGFVVEEAETPSGLSMGLRPESEGRAPSDWSVYLDGHVSPGAANPVPSAYWSTVADGAEMASDGFALGWSWVSDGDYQFQMDDDLDFTSPLVDLVLDAPRYAPDEPVPAGDYWWRVRPVSASGQLGEWSEPMSVGVSVIESTAHEAVRAAAQQVELDIDPIYQRKDTALLCLDGCSEGNPNDESPEAAWDSPHPTDDIYDHGRMNCVRASIAMIVTNYGGRLSQDRIAYQEWGGGRWMALGHNVGTLGCGSDGSVARELLAWALGVDVSEIVYGQGKPSFDDVRGWIDEGRPILRLSNGHATVIGGYRDEYFGTVRRVRLLDPWIGKGESWPNYDIGFGIECYYVPPATAPNVRSDEAGISLDSDGDGIMDFDEEIRWQESHADLASDNPDTDGDGVRDKADMRGYLFNDSGGLISRSPDIDLDGLFKEVDPDNDNGGSVDGCEDTNRNGRYEPELGETSNFDASQEKQCESYESAITDIVFDPPSPATLHYRETVDITFHYSTNYPGGFRMWAIGYADGDAQPYTGSELYNGPASGTATRGVSVWGGDGTVTIDTVKFRMVTEDRSTTLVEFTVPVEFNYVP
ncbi:MAG: hypothetical protein ACOC8C_01160 [Chloroflexota bacterium]